jgi:hypothetical protein
MASVVPRVGDTAVLKGFTCRVIEVVFAPGKVYRKYTITGKTEEGRGVRDAIIIRWPPERR